MKITKKNLIQRINRKLTKSSEKLNTSRKDSRLYWDLGQYYTVDIQRNLISRKDIDLADFARELGALGKKEQLEG